MAYANGTLHYNLPQTVGTDVRDWSDTNQAFEDVDTALYGAVSDVATASSKADALDAQINTPSTGLAAELSSAQSDIIALDGRVQTVEGTVSSHTNQIADVRSDCEDMIVAYNEASSTSTHNYSIGDKFIYNDVLYKATASIAIGDTITPDTNCTTTNVATLIDEVATEAAGVGDLSQLTTTDKSSAVAAINEVNSDLTWKSLGSATGTTPVVLPATFNQIFVRVSPSDSNYYRTAIIPAIALNSTSKYYYLDTSTVAENTITVTNSSVALSIVKDNNTDVTATATLDVYYR